MIGLLTYILRVFFAPGSTTTMEFQMLRMLNATRKRHQLPKLRMQDDLRRVARKHSSDMALQKYFAHENKSGELPHDRNKNARITDAHTGENLAMIRGHSHPTQRSHDSLYDSPGHRKNMLNRSYNCVGIGVVQAEDGTYYFTQNFAKRAIILKRIPKSVRRGKSLTVRGRAFMDLKQAIVRYQNIDAPLILEKNLKSQDRFTWHIRLVSKPHVHKLEVITSEDGTRFVVANQFTVRTRRFL